LGIGGGGRIARGGVSVGRGGVRGGVGVGPFSLSGGGGGSGSAGGNVLLGFIAVAAIVGLTVFGLLFFLTGAVIAMSYIVFRGGHRRELSEKQTWLWKYRLGIIRGSSAIVIVTIILIIAAFIEASQLNSCNSGFECRWAERDLQQTRDYLRFFIPLGLIHTAALATLRYSKVKDHEVWQLDALRWTQTYVALFNYCRSVPERLRRWADDEEKEASS
jgi:hypothetical protein